MELKPVAQEVLAEFRELVAAWNEGRLAESDERYADDAEIDVSAVIDGVKPIRGHHRIHEFWRQLRRQWDGLRVEVEGVYELEPGCYLAEQSLRGTRPTGEAVDQRLTYVYYVEPDGRVRRALLFRTVDEALRALADEG